MTAHAFFRFPRLRRRQAVNIASPVETITRRFRGRRVRLHVRSNTLDGDLPGMILTAASVYRLPETVEPKIIVDAGANIGVAAVYFALVYPEAKIFCFEPLPENVALLEANTEAFRDRVTVVPAGLSDRSGHFEYRMSGDPRSFGGGTFCRVGSDPDRSRTLPVWSVADALHRCSIDRIDALKLDTEGSEFSILNGMPATTRTSIQAIVGELHGVRDWDVFALLDASHALGIEKPVDRSCYCFTAIRPDLVGRPRAEQAA